ncbi:hypothetical protein [Aquimarina algiphila]|uniref:Uncharacterized protein n=1 Tax=Aquimarina algiphila TaxID=2047982 RepID=A0A554VFF8_9FLAO|nr:hypothetical protein [Aquimarina algiphila]TSE05857.1 hypothetical protein FOF46_21300 [Aquimarina algiphila]
MDVLKIAINWAKAELFSTPFFILFGLAFMAASLGFWQLGKTEMAKAYIIPSLVAGILLLTIGLGLFFTNKSRVTQFETAYNKDASAFIESEITRAEATLKEYNTIVFKVIPIIIIVSALLIIFINTPTWRAISITTIAMLIVILLVDGTAYGRIDNYHKELKLVHLENEIKK